MAARNGNGNGKRRSPRPLTQKAKDEFLNAVRGGATLEVAAQVAGLSRSVFHDLRRRDPDFKAAYEEALDAGTDLVEQSLFNIATGVEEVRNTARVTACCAILNARRPHIWRHPARGDSTPEPAAATIDLSRLTDEELDDLYAKLAKIAVDRSGLADSGAGRRGTARP